jgi:hypothetical protein
MIRTSTGTVSRYENSQVEGAEVEAETWVLIVLGCLLLLTTTCGFVFSAFMVFSSKELQRCPRCHRYGIAPPARFHVPSCPSNAERRLPPRRRWNIALHLEHR